MKKYKGKSIGIYSKWLNSLGGGEKVATVMADSLSKNNDVELISTFTLDKSTIEKKMGVDLGRVKLIAWNDRAYETLRKRTAKYDLFINTSYLDHLPSEANKAIYYLHFPSPIKTTIFGFIKYEAILPFLRRFLIIPEIDRGLERIDNIHSRGGSWLGKNNTLVISNTDKEGKMSIKIYTERFDLSRKDRIILSSKNSKLIVLDKQFHHKSNVIVYKLGYKKRNKTDSLVLSINIKGNIVEEPIAIVSITIRNFRYFAWNLIKKYLPDYEMALYGSSSYKPAAGLDTYDLFLSNSFFTQKWTGKYWKKQSKVLYPPVDVKEFKPTKKKKVILSVGRFFIGGHSKNQHILINAYKDMISAYPKYKRWELHLVGGVADGWEHAEYVRNLKEQAKGFNIYIHNSISFDELKKMYAQASVYWHATGFGQNESLSPISFEHFGIAPVEAMAAGCVPVVYRGGGLTETVEHGKDGYTWSSEDELIKYTLSLINNPKTAIIMSKKAEKKAQQFSRENFSKKLLEIIEEMT